MKYLGPIMIFTSLFMMFAGVQVQNIILREDVTALRAEIAASRCHCNDRTTTPPIPPTLPRPARDDRYRCVTCGEPVVNAVTDGRIVTHHVEPGRDREHAAKLSREDTQIIVDGLRMRD